MKRKVTTDDNHPKDKKPYIKIGPNPLNPEYCDPEEVEKAIALLFPCPESLMNTFREVPKQLRDNQTFPDQLVQLFQAAINIAIPYIGLPVEDKENLTLVNSHVIDKDVHYDVEQLMWFLHFESKFCFSHRLRFGETLTQSIESWILGRFNGYKENWIFSDYTFPEKKFKNTIKDLAKKFQNEGLRCHSEDCYYHYYPMIFSRSIPGLAHWHFDHKVDKKLIYYVVLHRVIKKKYLEIDDVEYFQFLFGTNIRICCPKHHDLTRSKSYPETIFVTKRFPEKPLTYEKYSKHRYKNRMVAKYKEYLERGGKYILEGKRITRALHLKSVTVDYLVGTVGSDEQTWMSESLIPKAVIESFDEDPENAKCVSFENMDSKEEQQAYLLRGEIWSSEESDFDESEQSDSDKSEHSDSDES